METFFTECHIPRVSLHSENFSLGVVVIWWYFVGVIVWLDHSGHAGHSWMDNEKVAGVLGSELFPGLMLKLGRCDSVDESDSDSPDTASVITGSCMILC
ncbi:hypothetical protein DPMN_169664 [Dreissena polymorpha]|uniref:Uncharacterized protein n=1 Tax=Dreissena polymorpha TaxID=45954 RepID=A0A9D4DYB8_DREPO|nr:hypothetical protein DPMN_169664 [Dreissena polymorpha]